MTEEQEMQQKVVLYQLLQKHMEELRQQKALLEQRFLEFETTRNALGDFRGKDEKELLVPLGSGCYMAGKSAGQPELLVNIGANIMLKKPIPETTKLLEERVKEIQDLSANLESQLMNVAGQIGSLSEEFEKLQQQHR